MTSERARNSRLKLGARVAGLMTIAVLVALVAMETALPRPALAQNQSQATYETVLFEGWLQPGKTADWCRGYFLHSTGAEDEIGAWFTGLAGSTVPVDGSPVIRDLGKSLKFNLICNENGRSTTYIRFMPENPKGHDDYGDLLAPGRYVMEVDGTRLTFDGVDNYVETPKFPFPPRSYTVLGATFNWHNRQADDDLVKVRFTVVRQDHDADDNGLIEVDSLAKLDAIRLDLDGDGIPARGKEAEYLAVFPGHPQHGCPDTGCVGYELKADLNFDTNNNGRADSGDAWWNGGAGWRPIGHHNDGAFTAEFHGNAHAINNLYINATGKHTGLFGRIGGSAYVHHVALPGIDIVSSNKDVGALVGFIQGNQAAVGAAYATGIISGGNQTGGLVGSNQGYVVTSWTDVTVNGARHVGGVVGHNRGSVHGVYALGMVLGTTRSHGVVGWNGGGYVGHSYYNSDNHDEGTDELGKTTAELQEPTDYSGIYAEWDLDTDRTDNAGFNRQGDPWNFGGSSDYPKLRTFQQGNEPADFVGGL